MNSKNTQKVVFRVGNIKENAHQKTKIHTENAKMQMSFLLKEKNPCKQKLELLFLFQKEQQKLKLLFLLKKEQQKTQTAVPFEKGTAKNSNC